MSRDHQERDPRFRLNREATVCWDCHGYVVGSQSKSVKLTDYQISKHFQNQ
jgi:hypothetical protein